jgi:uncharacterized caspase-like protein
MKNISKLLASCLLLFSFALASPLKAEGEKRIAFVVGNATYPAGPLATSANDAGLIAQTLQAAGFDVAGARDLDGEGLRGAFRDFLDKAQASGPDTVAFVYLSGYGLQLDGDNYFVPVDAKIASAPDVAVEALRISDYMKRLSGLPLKASFIVLDTARETPFASGQTLAGGLALAEAEPNMLVAFNAAPGTVAPGESGPYGAYAKALAEMVREGGMAPAQVFDAVRLRVNEETKGAEVPWSTSRIAAPFAFFERAADAPPPPFKASEADAMRARPLRDLGVQDAYAAAIERDSLQGYEEFLAAYPSDPLAKRVRALLAARREAIVWRRTCTVNTPDAYWSYLDRYPHGPHVPDARWRLEALAAPVLPPPSFAPIAYDVPPPPPAEIVYVSRPVLVLGDPVFGFVPPPPIAFLAPVPAYVVFAPPPPPFGLFVLPIPLFAPFPAFISPPPYVVAPPNNVYFANIHNTTVINNINNTVINQAAHMHEMTAAGFAAGAAAGAMAARVALPPSLARKSELMGQGLREHGISPPASPGLPGGAQTSHALPGLDGKPLPGVNGKQGNLPTGPGSLPGSAGKPASPTGGNKATTSLGEPGQLPGGQGAKGSIPGRITTSPGNNPPKGLGHPPVPSGAGGGPAAGVPHPVRPAQHPPQPPQQKPQHQTYVPAPQGGQQQHPPTPQGQQGRPPQQAQSHPPFPQGHPPQQPQSRPPPQGQRACGKPGQPRCR